MSGPAALCWYIFTRIMLSGGPYGKPARKKIEKEIGMYAASHTQGSSEQRRRRARGVYRAAHEIS